MELIKSDLNLLGSILYKGNNQHRRGIYFQKLMQVFKELIRLTSDENKSILEAMDAHKYTYIDSVKIESELMLNNIKKAIVLSTKAFGPLYSLLGQTYFMPFALITLSILSRVIVILRYTLIDLRSNCHCLTWTKDLLDILSSQDKDVKQYSSLIINLNMSQSNDNNETTSFDFGEIIKRDVVECRKETVGIKEERIVIDKNIEMVKKMVEEVSSDDEEEIKREIKMKKSIVEENKEEKMKMKQNAFVGHKIEGDEEGNKKSSIMKKNFLSASASLLSDKKINSIKSKKRILEKQNVTNPKKKAKIASCKEVDDIFNSLFGDKSL